jgi:hypothetical protein
MRIIPVRLPDLIEIKDQNPGAIFRFFEDRDRRLYIKIREQLTPNMRDYVNIETGEIGQCPETQLTITVSGYFQETQ